LGAFGTLLLLINSGVRARLGVLRSTLRAAVAVDMQCLCRDDVPKGLSLTLRRFKLTA